MTHNGVGESSDGVLWGVLSASATKLCLPPETYVTLDVDHGASCTCHWTFVGYPKPVGGCVGSSQWTRWLYHLQLEQDMSRSRWPQGEVQHLWDTMVGIPTPPERDFGWLIYAGLDCSYDGHREDSYPMWEVTLNYTCTGYEWSFDLRPWFGHLSRGGRSWIWWACCPIVTRVSTRMWWETHCPDMIQWFVGFQNLPRLFQRRSWQWLLLWCSSCRQP